MLRNKQQIADFLNIGYETVRSRVKYLNLEHVDKQFKLGRMYNDNQVNEIRLYKNNPFITSHDIVYVTRQTTILQSKLNFLTLEQL
jgi:hypothetical protein